MSGHRIPSLNWLRVFEAAARGESFAAAARQLNMSPPAVSQQIRALETQLGTQLFRRHAHSVELTATGRAFLPSVQHALMSIEATADGLFGQPRQEMLYIQSVLIFAMGFLTTHLSRFREEHPNVNIQMATGNYIEDFSRGYADLQVIFGSPASLGKKGDLLIGERLYPVARPEIAKTIGEPRDLLGHVLLEVGSHSVGWINFLDAVECPDASPQLMFVDSTVISFALASGGNGIALARAPVSDSLETMYGLTRCLPDVFIDGAEHYHLVYHDRATLRPAARRFRDWILAETNALSPE